MCKSFFTTLLKKIVMKRIFALLMLLSVIACNEPMNITAHPDDRAATSGTLGSAKAENQLPNNDHDSTTRADTSRKN